MIANLKKTLIGTTRVILGVLLVCVISWTDSKPLFLPLGSVPEQPMGPKPSANDGVESRATFLAVGDVMLSRGVDRAIDREDSALLPFSELTDLFDSADFSFGNFESPVSGNDHRFGKGLVFNTHRPDIEGLIKYKFKIVNLANNHALDQGIDGLRSTLAFFASRGIACVGVGENKKDAWQGKVIDANGIRIGFLGASYSSINDGGASTNRFVARIEDHDHLRAAISQLKAESDLVVVTIHAGVEYTRYPHRSQIDFAHRAIDAGADLVIGTHPHWIQTLEKYHGKSIFYSLGNFIFDQRKTNTREGLVLRVTVSRPQSEQSPSMRAELDQIELIPVVIEHIGIPRKASEAESTAILRKIGITDVLIMPGRRR